MTTEVRPASARGSSPLARTGAAAVALVVLGMGLWLVWRLLAGNEGLSYADGVAPGAVRLAAGHSYTLAIRGGVPAEQRLGVRPSELRCTSSSPRTGLRPLAVSPEPLGTKAVNQIGRFVSPYTGSLHVACAGLPTVYVDDAASAPADHAGLVLLLACLALAVGLPLALSVVRRSARGRAREDQQIE